jgi:hypothetical protein
LGLPCAKDRLTPVLLRVSGLTQPQAVRGAAYPRPMIDRVWTAQELEQMSPDDRQRLVRASMVDDLSKLPAPLVERLRKRGEELMTTYSTARRYRTQVPE